MYVVALYVMGSFKEWCTDPMHSLEDATEFMQDPPSCWSLRPQDEFWLFELTPDHMGRWSE